MPTRRRRTPGAFGSLVPMFLYVSVTLKGDVRFRSDWRETRMCHGPGLPSEKVTWLWVRNRVTPKWVALWKHGLKPDVSGGLISTHTNRGPSNCREKWDPTPQFQGRSSAEAGCKQRGSSLGIHKGTRARGSQWVQRT